MRGLPIWLFLGFAALLVVSSAGLVSHNADQSDITFAVIDVDGIGDTESGIASFEQGWTGDSTTFGTSVSSRFESSGFDIPAFGAEEGTQMWQLMEATKGSFGHDVITLTTLGGTSRAPTLGSEVSGFPYSIVTPVMDEPIWTS